MKQRPYLFATLAFSLFVGCSDGDGNNPSGGGTAGTGGGTGSTTASTGGASTGGGGSDAGGSSTGGIGGFGGSGGSGGTPVMCSIVLDEPGHAVNFNLDGVAMTLSEPCFPDQGIGPNAFWFMGKGGGDAFEIHACMAPDYGLPSLEIFIASPQQPDSVTTIVYTDEAGAQSQTEVATATVTVYGDVWADVKGNFAGDLASQDGTLVPIDGKFMVCRRPDLLAP